MDIRIGAYGVIIENGHILLTHWNDGRAWTLPGGGLDPGEDPADAAVREIFEETGLTATVDRLLGLHTLVVPADRRMQRNDRPLHALRVVYRATVLPGDLVIELDGSSDDARWILLDELANLPVLDLVGVALTLNRDQPADGRLRALS
jgi:8-oxo-dGTP diphosphatase